MNFVEYVENQYQELTLYQQTNGFKVGLDGQIHTLQMLLGAYRTTLKWLFIPKVIINFLLVNLKLVKAPQPLLMQKIKEKKEQEDAKKSGTSTTDKVVAIKPT